MFITIVILLLFISIIGWLSMIRSALISINANKIKVLAESGDEKSSLIYKNIDRFGKYFSFIQIGLTVAILGCGFVGYKRLLLPVNYLFIKLGIDFKYNTIEVLSNIIIIAAIALVIIIFGEFIPKKVGIKSPEKIVAKNLKTLNVCTNVFFPVIILVNAVANVFVRLLGIKPSDIDSSVTEEEIRLLVDAGGDSGGIDENEKEMINNIFEFDNLTAGEISTHRTDIAAIDISSNIEDVKSIILEEKYSRIPVYEDTIDNIVGIFHIKDIVQYILDGEHKEDYSDFQLSKIMMKPYYVPFSKKGDELLEEMQKNKVQMAVVIDEYGGTAGIVTMEDLLEKIVGNIFDEYDEEEEEVKVVDENTFVVFGTTSLEDIQEIIDMDIPEEDEYDTVGGLIIGHLGRVPDDDEKPEVIIGDYKFQVEKIIDKRIEDVRIIKM